MRSDKILFVYTSNEDSEDYNTESLWADKMDNLYKVNSIPFFINNIAVGDIIKVEKDGDNGLLYFDELVETSGNSVIRIILFNSSHFNETTKNLIDLGCDWESMEGTDLIAVHIPKSINYQSVFQFLTSQKNNLDFEEACIGSIN